MKHHPLKNWGADLPASVVVLLVAIPLCLGIALGSNAPLFSGIIAGIVGGIVVGLLSGSQLSVSGPAAGLTVIVAGGIALLPTFEAFLAAVVMAGAIQLLLGVLKAGVIGDYVPHSVIKGMLAAIGIILILKQIPHLFGYDADFEGDESFIQPDNENTFSELFNMVHYIQPGAIIIGSLAMLILIIWETKWVKKSRVLSQVPGPLLAVIGGTLLNIFFTQSGAQFQLQSEHLVGLPIANSFSSFFGFFTNPDPGAFFLPEVWKLAVTLALVASLETLLSIEAIDKLDPYKRISPPNRELMAQGVGNIVSGMIGGLPVTSVIVRSSANVASGGKTKMAAIMHGVLLLAFVMLIPGVLNQIPLSALAAILIFVGYKLAKISLFREFWTKGYQQFIPFVVTILAILFTDLLVGVLIGIGVSILFMVWSNFHSAVMVVHDNKLNYLLRLRKNVNFLNKPLLKRELDRIPENAKLIIDVTWSDFIDMDVIDTINEYLIRAKDRNIQVSIIKSEFKQLHTFLQEPAVITLPSTS